MLALLAQPAEFVEPDRAERTDQREAGDQREQQRQGVAAAEEAPEDQPDDGIDQRYEDREGGNGQEVRKALGEGLLDVVHADLAHRGRVGGVADGGCGVARHRLFSLPCIRPGPRSIPEAHYYGGPDVTQ